MITSDLVQKLRASTGAGMMECKRALETAAGDIEAAVKILREKGAASAAQRAGRVAAHGLVTYLVEGPSAVLLELNCETDFVAGTDDFKAVLSSLTEDALKASPPWKSAAEAPQEKVKEAAIRLKENIVFRRFARFDRREPGVFSVYIHPSGKTGTIGTLLELGAEDEKALTEEAKTLAKQLAMQVAAASPKWIRKEDVPSDIVESEKAIGREQAKRENKPEKIWDKIAEGKLTQFYQQFCLMEQAFVHDQEKKPKVQSVVEKVSASAGSPLTVRRFVRYKVGEE